MNEYLFFTTKKGLKNQYLKDRIIKGILLAVFSLLVSPLLLIGLIFDLFIDRRNIVILLKEVISFFKEDEKEYQAYYMNITNNTILNLTEYYTPSDSEDEIIKEIIEVIEHEDIHRALRFTALDGDSEFIIERMTKKC